MTLIYIQQRSYHYIILWVDVGVVWCLYLNVDGSGMAHADMVCMICIMFVICIYTVSMRPNLNLVWWFFKGSSQPPLVPLFCHLTDHQWLIVSVCPHIVSLGPILWRPGMRSMNGVCLLLRLSELFSLFVELRHCYLECD